MTQQTFTLKHGDCVDVLAQMDEASIGSVICDPPYGLAFMGKDFDKLGDGESQQRWHKDWLEQAYRVLQPGGVLKAFSGTRTFHRLAAAMADAGYEDIRLEAWLYGSGFPKSLNLGHDLEGWKGWGTALKPAWEPVLVGRKPK